MLEKSMDHDQDPIYLDYNATSPVLPSVAAAVAESLGEYGNPSSVHASGRRARAVIETAREAVAGAVGASPPNVVFTSGGTEANALALRGLLTSAKCTSVIGSAVEHPSVLAHVREGDRI